MKKHLLIALCMLSSQVLIFAQENPIYTIMNWNLTHARKKDPKNISPWKERQDRLIEHIASEKRDFYTFQEVIDEENQFKSVQEALPNYDWVGEKRNTYLKGSSYPWLWFVSNFAQDERSPIFYNKEKFELVSSKTFSINTPNYTWKSVPRVANIALFKDIITKKELCICNCHLDHKSDAARILQIKLILEEIAQEYSNKEVILTGDFNTTFDNDLKNALTKSGFIHASDITEQRIGQKETHKKSSTNQLMECDHILIKPVDKFTVLKYETENIISEKISDHNPIGMSFSLKE